MSKCDIQIMFDRPERQFRSGELVTGKVNVRVNKDVNCRGLLISGYWKTHGRGNRDDGNYDETNVFSGEMQAGQSYEFPFEITAPSGPLTYRGKLINVDHYVRVRVDIPWAIDPKQEDEFILLPSPADGITAGPSALATRLGGNKSASAGSNSAARLIGLGVSVILLVVFTRVFLPHNVLGILVLGIGSLVLAGIAFRRLRNVLAERRLGQVDLTLESALVAPGQKLPVNLSFTPTKNGTVREVTASLTGKEIAVSGSGTDKTTHRHTLHEQKVTLDGPTKFTVKTPVLFSGVVQVPETNAYSFNVGENQVNWSLAVRIDIPMWPDWFRLTPLQLVPPEHLSVDENDARQVEVVNSQAETVVEQPAIGQANAIQQEVSMQTEAAEPKMPAAAPPGNTSPMLLEAIRLLSKVDRYSDDHDRILDSIKRDTFELTVAVERIVSSYERFEDPSYQGGKTISGVISGTDHAIQVNMPRSSNDKVSRLHSGDTWRGRGRVVEWDALYGRLEVLGQ